jgi:hypothetical protein
VLSADGLPTRLVVTRSGMRTRQRSTAPYRCRFAADVDALLPTLAGSATAARRLVPVIFGAGWLDR